MFILWLFWLFRWINIKPTISFINYLDLKKRNILIFTESAFNHFVRFTNVNSLMFVGLYFFFQTAKNFVSFLFAKLYYKMQNSEQHSKRQLFRFFGYK